jgi:hypothetical protein
MALGMRAAAGIALVLAAALAVTGCSSKSAGQNYFAAAAKSLIAGRKAAQAAVKPDQVTREQLAAQGGPVMRLRVASRGIDTFLVRYQQSGPIAVWTDGSGVTFTFRNGVLIESRGVGGDLMSSSAPAPGQLAGGGSHARVYFVNGDEDRNERRDYRCDAVTSGSETLVLFGRSHATRHVTETCSRAQGRFANEYWFEGGTIRKSKEWLSPSIGYVVFERIID